MSIWILVIMLMLTTMSVVDIRKKELSVFGVILLIVIKVLMLCFICFFKQEDKPADTVLNWSTVIISMIPGLIFMLSHIFMPEKTGGADGPVLIGALLGMDPVGIYIATLSMTIVSFVVMIILKMAGKEKGARIPYIPVISIATATGYLIRI